MSVGRTKLGVICLQRRKEGADSKVKQESRLRKRKIGND